MASSGKKGKKNKGTVVSLQSFLSNGVGTPLGITQVTKKVRNLEADDSDDSSHVTTQIYQLPTAPRANRVLDDDSIPRKPPFLAFITNLPFDVQEKDFEDMLFGVAISSVRLPREDGEGGRIRGFGYVEFDTRDDLIYVLGLPDPQIRGRRIRIDVSNGNESSVLRQKSNRRGYDGFGSACESRDSTNWRENLKSDDGQKTSFRTFDRSANREIHPRDDGGSWRSGNRSVQKSLAGNRNEQTSFNEGFRDNSRQISRETDDVSERPKLVLKPRSLPLPNSSSTETSSEPKQIKSTESSVRTYTTMGASSEKIYGSAKPVDTAARELEIEGRVVEVGRRERTQRVHEFQGSESNFEAQQKQISKSNSTFTNWRSVEKSVEKVEKRGSLEIENKSNECKIQEIQDDNTHLDSTNGSRVRNPKKEKKCAKKESKTSILNPIVH